ncbi:MAG: SDR family oxidoreductase [Acidobacteriota bacterium]
MPDSFPKASWALILGGSSGFGLASAAKLAAGGMNLIIFHRDRRGAMARIEEDFAALRNQGVEVLTFNADALSAEVREDKLEEIAGHLGDDRIHLLLHSIAFGNLKLSVAEKPADDSAVSALAERLGIEVEKLQTAADELFAEGADRLQLLAAPPQYSASLFLEEEDLARTIHAMGTSLLGWVQAIHGRGLFAADARVLGLTSEGNTIAWKGYAAVAAAKVALESVARSIAVEFAPYGIRCNVLQPGVTETPALRLIPGNAHLKAEARSKNPFGRLTQPEDVADVVSLMAQPEAAWINGALIRVDGGEHVSGVRQ